MAEGWTGGGKDGTQETPRYWRQFGGEIEYEGAKWVEVIRS